MTAAGPAITVGTAGGAGMVVALPGGGLDVASLPRTGPPVFRRHAYQHTPGPGARISRTSPTPEADAHSSGDRR
jgi:hypothetical protein